jgi:hypothetical protein
MGLAPGLRFRVAPLFHCRADWPERLRLNGGAVQCEGVALPRDDWRRCSAVELDLLVGRSSVPSGCGDTIDLLTLPAHVRRWWWEQLETDDAAPDTRSRYAGFVGDLRDFLRFKRLPVPDECKADVVASRPGQMSIRLDSNGTVAGFRFGALAPQTIDAAPIAVFNLGDEATHVVVLNRAGPTNALAELLAPESAYPLVRVRIDPGEGLWFPSPPPAFDGWTIGKDDVDVVLVLYS